MPASPIAASDPMLYSVPGVQHVTASGIARLLKAEVAALLQVPELHDRCKMPNLRHWRGQSCGTVARW